MRKGERIIKNHPAAGVRCEIHPGSDLWMRGARFGVVQRVVTRGAGNEEICEIRMDHPQVKRLHRQYYADCSFFGGYAASINLGR